MLIVRGSGIHRLRFVLPWSALLFAFLFGALTADQAQSSARTLLAAPLPSADALDAGTLPTSTRLSLTVTLAPSPAQQAALAQLLSDLGNPASPGYHQWLTPAQFAAGYGASAAQIAAASAWLSAQGLSVDAISPSATRLSVSGFAAQIESAFQVSLHSYQVQGSLYFANANPPSLPSEAASLIASVDGLSSLPGTAPVAFSALAAQVDANSSAVLIVDAGASSNPAAQPAFAELFQQAAAQGITTLVHGTASALPSSAEVTAVALAGDPPPTAVATESRPLWQVAPGLPTDGLRAVPDVTVTSLAAFRQAITSLTLTCGGRLGNINPRLYQLAPLPGLYDQSDNATAGTWERATGLGTLDLARFVHAYPLGTGTSTLSLSSSAYAPTHGQSFSLTASESSTSNGPIPTGTVTFTSPQAGFTPASIAINPGGSAVLTNLLLPGGTYLITAAYSGDNSYSPVSSTVTVTVQPEPALFTITAPASATLGSNITATVTLQSASGVGTPSASVIVTPSGISGATAQTQTVTGSNGTASASYTFTTKQAGSVSLQASCTSSDQSFSCYTPQTITSTVAQSTPSIVLTAPATATSAQQVTLSAAVTGVAGINPGGTVQFFDGANALGTGSAPNATFTTSFSGSANHLLTAVYQGDTNYLTAKSNAVTTAVGTIASTTTVSASATSATFGQTVTLNITVAGPAGGTAPQPTGTLTFTGAGSVNSATVLSGTATVALPNLAVGTWTIATTYSGDTNYSPSTGNTVVLTVTPATATLSSQLSSSAFTTGSTASLTSTIQLPGNAQLPAGTTFIATILNVPGAVYSGTFSINPGGNSGTGAVTILAPSAGSYTLQVTCGAIASFTCTPNNLPITSTATSTSTPTGTTASSTTLAISPTAPTAGQPITLTATVSAAAAAVAANLLTGTVNFYDGTTLLGAGTITTTAGVATATATATLTGSSTAHTLTAVYLGNTTYATSTSAAIAVTVAASPAAITLASNVTSSLAGNNVVLTATVTGSSSTGAAPTGTVTFYVTGSSAALLGTATLGSTGNGVATAVFSTSNLPSGALTLYAVYAGDTNFGKATSNNITLGVSDYSVSFVPQTLTLTAGQTGSTSVIIAAIGTAPAQVTLACTPDPSADISCFFSPATVSGAGTSTLTITTHAATVRASNQPHTWPFAAAGAGFAALLCCLLPARRRRIPVLLLLLLGLSLSFNLGCGAGNFSPFGASSLGTPLGTTLMTITTAGTTGNSSVHHDYTYQVTVQ